MFKWIGLAIGFVSLGFVGALIGYLIGATVDRIRELGTGGFNPITAGQRQTIFLETVFTLQGLLAKADGVITQHEIDHVEAFIRKIGMTSEHRKEAINLFKTGAAPGFDPTETLNKFQQYCGHTANLRQMLMVYLIVMALADGKLEAAERTVLERIAQALNYSAGEFQQLMDMILSQAQFASGKPAPTQDTLADAYQALGVTADSSDQEIKRAYRKLMSQYHPDKLMGQGLPKDMIDVATEQTKEIQLAYDLIKKHRGQ